MQRKLGEMLATIQASNHDSIIVLKLASLTIYAMHINFKKNIMVIIDIAYSYICIAK